jgi:hypothetical protein
MRLCDYRAQAVVRAFSKRKPVRLGPMTGRQFRELVIHIQKRKETAA